MPLRGRTYYPNRSLYHSRTWYPVPTGTSACLHSAHNCPLTSDNAHFPSVGGISCFLSVTGKDQVGIIAKVCTYLAEDKINILDISQTIVNGYFNMMMIVDLTGCSDRVSEVIDQLANLGKEIGVDIRLQREDIFDNMHRI